MAAAGKYTVGTWVETWLENYAKVNLRPSTYKTDKGIYTNHIKPNIGKILLTKLTTLDLQKFYKDRLENGRVQRRESKSKGKGLAPKTVRLIHKMISSALDLAVAQKLIAENPAKECKLPKIVRKEMQTLSEAQLNAFFEEAKNSGVYELYYLDLATGLRRGELLGLMWSDVDWSRGVVNIRRAVSRQTR